MISGTPLLYFVLIFSSYPSNFLLISLDNSMIHFVTSGNHDVIWFYIFHCEPPYCSSLNVLTPQIINKWVYKKCKKSNNSISWVLTLSPSLQLKSKNLACKNKPYSSKIILNLNFMFNENRCNDNWYSLFVVFCPFSIPDERISQARRAPCVCQAQNEVKPTLTFRQFGKFLAKTRFCKLFLLLFLNFAHFRCFVDGHFVKHYTRDFDWIGKFFK